MKQKFTHMPKEFDSVVVGVPINLRKLTIIILYHFDLVF